MNAYQNMLGGYRDRVARIALFDVFHHMAQRQMKDDDGRPMEPFGLGLLSVLFFFENMLMRKKNTGVRELAAFLQKMLSERHMLSDESSLHLAKQVIETFRPSSGKRLYKTFFNYETGEEEILEYAILKADAWDADNRIQYYTLADQGLELIFATKEYFSEFQISISQLVLRKQLEKGEFAGALRQVDEMRINVHSIRDKMAKIRHEIQRNIISDDTYERYKETIDDINRRLHQEHDEFEELVGFIHETRQRLDRQNNHPQKELEALEMVVRVDNELAHVHYLHASLLKESIELKTTAIEAAGESLYYAGVTSFNFDQEIARKLTTAPLPFEAARTLMAPFTRLGKFHTWSLLTVFDHQMLERPERHLKNDYLELDEGPKALDIQLRQQINSLLVKEMMTTVDGRTAFRLSDVLNSSESQVFGTREFCDLWIIIHQLSPVNIPAIIEIDDHIFAKAFKDHLSDYRTIRVEELSEDISVRGNYQMKNMQLILEGDRHDG